MKTGILWAITVGAGLLLVTTPAEARSGFKSRTKRAEPLLAQNMPRPKLGHSAHKGLNPGVGVPPSDVSPEAAEVVWLYHHGFSSDELLHYVNKSHANFKLSVGDVNYLKDVGISTEVVVAMIRPAEARENVARLRERLPGWASYALFSKHHQTGGEPNNPPEQSEIAPSEPVDANSEDNLMPNYYGPSDNSHSYPGVGPGYRYGVPGYDRFNGYPGVGPYYNGYGRRGWWP